MFNLPPKEIMRKMTQLAIKEVTTLLAQQAREFAPNLPAGTTGAEALEAFARAIESTNEKIYPKGEPHA
jgi:hypothetical protein